MAKYVWLTCNATLEYGTSYDECDGPAWSRLDAFCWKTRAEAESQKAHLTVRVLAADLPKYYVSIDIPTKPVQYKKWFKTHGKWANQVAPYLGLQPFYKPLEDKDGTSTKRKR